MGYRGLQMGTGVLGLAVAIVLCLAAGAVGSTATADAIPTWYATLRKPSFNGPVSRWWRSSCSGRRFW